MKPFKNYILYQCDLFNKLILNKSYSGKCRWHQTNSPMRCSRYWTILFAQAVLTLLLLLVFTSSKAQILYSKAFGTSGGDIATDIIITHDNNYALFGWHYKNLYLVLADTAAELIWEKSYPVDSNSIYTSSICEIGDTSYIMSGQYQNTGFLLKVNTVGDTLFSLNDSTILGNNVSNLRQAPDGNLLALVTFNGTVSLVKFDNNLNVTGSINNFSQIIKDIQVINNKIYLLKKDSLNNLLIIDDNLIQIDTNTIPIKQPLLIRKSSDINELIFYGENTLGPIASRKIKMVYTDLNGNVNSVCDSVYNTGVIDFQINDLSNNFVFSSSYYNSTWGIDIRLYFTDNCGQILHDTILYRSGVIGDPWREEWVVKQLTDLNGNYILYGKGEKGPLGDWDILLWIYKQWDGFPTGIDDIENVPLLLENKPVIYPNPTQHQFTVSGITENSSITVMDVMGKVVYHQPNTINQTQIITNNWAKGLYVVQIKGNTTTTSLKVVKQ